MNEFSEYWALSTVHRKGFTWKVRCWIKLTLNLITFFLNMSIECLLKFFCKIKLIEGKNYDVKRNSFERAMKLNQINQDTKYAKKHHPLRKKECKNKWNSARILLYENNRASFLRIFFHQIANMADYREIVLHNLQSV